MSRVVADGVTPSPAMRLPAPDATADVPAIFIGSAFVVQRPGM